MKKTAVLEDITSPNLESLLKLMKSGRKYKIKKYAPSFTPVRLYRQTESGGIAPIETSYAELIGDTTLGSYSPTINRNDGSIVGYWGNGLTEEEQMVISRRYSLEIIDPNKLITIAEDEELDLSVAEHASKFMILSNNQYIAISQENANTETRCYFERSDEQKLVKLKTIERVSLLQSYLNADLKFKALALELAAYRSSNAPLINRLPDEDIQIAYINLLMTADVAAQERTLNMLTSLKDGSGNVEIAFHRLQNRSRIIFDPQTGYKLLEGTGDNTQTIQLGITKAKSLEKLSRQKEAFERIMSNDYSPILITQEAYEKQVAIEAKRTNPLKAFLDELNDDEEVKEADTTPNGLTFDFPVNGVTKSFTVKPGYAETLNKSVVAYKENELDKWAKEQLKDEEAETYFTQQTLADKKAFITFLAGKNK